MTDESMVPEWMKRKRDEKRRRQELQDLEDHKALTAKLLIETQGPQYWQSLKEKLQITVESLPVLGLTGSFTSPLNDPNHIHIEVTKPSQFVKLSKADVHFDGQKIATNGLVGHLEFRLVVNPSNQVGANFPGQPTMCSATDAVAERIMSHMVDQVERG